MQKHRILLKITGNALQNEARTDLDATLVRSLARQIKELIPTHLFGIVIGGGNFFRGKQHGATLGITPAAADHIGMMATAMNGLIIQDIFAQESIPARILTAFECPALGQPVTTQHIGNALEGNRSIIFVGGTGNPFFTTDTTAIIRALQMNASQVWKATNVEGVFDADPRTNPQTQLIKQLTHQQALARNLGIMDATAFTMAMKYGLPIRVFSVKKDKALTRAAHEPDFGSLITN